MVDWTKMEIIMFNTVLFVHDNIKTVKREKSSNKNTKQQCQQTA